MCAMPQRWLTAGNESWWEADKLHVVFLRDWVWQGLLCQWQCCVNNNLALQHLCGNKKPQNGDLLWEVPETPIHSPVPLISLSPVGVKVALWLFLESYDFLSVVTSFSGEGFIQRADRHTLPSDTNTWIAHLPTKQSHALQFK